MKIASGKVGLTQKTEEERQAEESMAKSGVGAGFKKKATNTLEAALAQAGFKSSPKTKASHVLCAQYAMQYRVLLLVLLLAGHQPCIVGTSALPEVLVKMPTNTLQAFPALVIHLSDSPKSKVYPCLGQVSLVPRSQELKLFRELFAQLQHVPFAVTQVRTLLVCPICSAACEQLCCSTPHDVLSFRTRVHLCVAGPAENQEAGNRYRCSCS